MIEKLKTIDPYSQEELDMSVGSLGGLVYENSPLIQTVNQLVDAVNEIMTWRFDCDDEPTISKMETVDPYAEAQKWVGCICRFWYDNSDDTCLDYLDKVQIGKDGLEYRGKETYDWFPYCEPVLPTDKAIYKGGKDEL